MVKILNIFIQIYLLFRLEKVITNGTDQQESPIVTSKDIILEENFTTEILSNDNIPSLSAGNEHSMLSIQNNSEATALSTDEILQSKGAGANDDDVFIVAPIDNQSDDNNQVAPIPEISVESELNGDIHEESQTNNMDGVFTLEDPTSTPNNTEDNPDDILDDDDQRKLNHSDSLYLLRKKAQHEDNDTSDDESDLSSSIEQPQQQLTDGV
ncbi:unnamed protein product [Rotaria magnacalcarata]|uniref:Uncharacterized protein n=2 Tax=Rotaria magnacalcarata TaxID=392030 RepID=A0A8S2ZTC6_9BILA|nr:unnamed protein product [Rotaria magnacalcarata]